MGRSDAYERFQKSMVIGFDQWHDGIGYDLDAFRAMRAEEQAEVVKSLKARGPNHDWRDIEVFELADSLAAPPKMKKDPKKKAEGKRPIRKEAAEKPVVQDTWSPASRVPAPKTSKDARDALRKALKASKVETRLHAAVALRDLGDMPDFVAFLAEQLAHVGSYNGLSYSLGLIEESSPKIRDALLRGARDRPEVAPHFAAKLCQLAGRAKTDFDWEMRAFFLRFGEHSPAEDRAKAYKELLNMISAKDPR